MPNVKLVWFIGSICFGVHLGLKAQSDSLGTDLSPEQQLLIEQTIETQGGEDGAFDNDTNWEELELRRQNRLNLNTASAEQLAALGILNDVQIQLIVEYRKRYGLFLTLNELGAMGAFDKNQFEQLDAFVKVEIPEVFKKIDWSKLFKYGRKTIFTRWSRTLQTQDGYARDTTNSNRYLGSPDRLYTRFRFDYSHRVSLNLTLEKDAGERLAFGAATPLGFDFASGHVAVKNLTPWLSHLVIGDFQVSMGQGLIAWNAFGVRKGAMVNGLRRTRDALRAYSSAGEALFFRGVGASFQPIKNLDLTAFGSYRKRDAGFYENNDTLNFYNNEQYLASLQETGLHRTPSEIEKRNALSELVYGGKASYRAKFFQLGLNAINTQYSTPLRPNSQLYAAYNFSGSQLLNLSADYSFFYRGVIAWGELGYSPNGAIAQIHGLSTALGGNAQFSLVYRNYPANFQTIYGNAFGESSGNKNEEGLYLALRVPLFKGLALNVFADYYRFPWLRFGADAPSYGRDYYARLDWSPSRSTNFFIQYRDETKLQNNASFLGEMDVLAPYSRRTLRAAIVRTVSPEWQFRLRVDVAQTRITDSIRTNWGLALHSDLIYTPARISGLRVHGRFSIFDVDAWDARIYSYEPDALYSFTVPAYYRQGFKFLLLVKYQIKRNISLWARVAQTQYTDNRSDISSGLEAIQGQSRTDVKLQIMYKF